MDSSQPNAGNASRAGPSGSNRGAGHAATGSRDGGSGNNNNDFSGSYNTTPPLGPPQNPFIATNTSRSYQSSIAESGALPVPPKVATSRAHRHHPSHSNGSSNNTKKTVTSGGTAGTAVASASTARPQPAVYWSDKKSMDQGRTFFNDDSPPPSPSLMGTTNKGSSIGQPSGKGPILSYGSGAGSGDYDYRYDHVAPPAPIPEKKKGFGFIPQKQKKWIWVVIGVLIVVILALAIGLGVGLSQNNSGDGDGDNSSDQSSEEDSEGSDGPNNRPSTSVTVTGTSTIPITTSTTNTEPESQACPAANDTRFSVPNTEKTFLRVCGIDYQGRGGTEELAIVWTASMQDCMVNCAGFDECTACSWGAVAGDSYRDNHRCYLKTNLGKRNKARPGWDFAMLVDDDDD